jgi:glycosyltransferase involved in cell wall biosynthesis
MKVLIVCSFNSGSVSPFIQDQVESLRRSDVIVDYYLISGKGIFGYLSNVFSYHKKIKDFRPDIIHAHFGLTGLFACFQFGTPLVITYHGSDINIKSNLFLSKLAMSIASKNVFVSNSLLCLAKIKGGVVIPCGVDFNVFKPMDKQSSREKLDFKDSEKYVLFSSSFTRSVKNSSLALETADSLKNVTLIELKGFSRDKVALLMNASDACLSTSFTEGSPQFIKEALCCNAKVVSTRVGDLNEYASDLAGFYYTNFDVDSCIDALNHAFIFEFSNSDNENRSLVMDRFDNNNLSHKLINLYKSLL